LTSYKPTRSYLRFGCTKSVQSRIKSWEESSETREYIWLTRFSMGRIPVDSLPLCIYYWKKYSFLDKNMKHTFLIIGIFILIVACAGCTIEYDPTIHYYPTNTSDPLGCEIGLTNCSGSCRDLQIDYWNCGSCGNICSGTVNCIQGICQCKPGYTRCNIYCANLQKDKSNCGECHRECDSDEYCSRGSCTWR